MSVLLFSVRFSWSDWAALHAEIKTLKFTVIPLFQCRPPPPSALPLSLRFSVVSHPSANPPHIFSPCEVSPPSVPSRQHKHFLHSLLISTSPSPPLLFPPAQQSWGQEKPNTHSSVITLTHTHTHTHTYTGGICPPPTHIHQKWYKNLDRGNWSLYNRN